MSGEKAAKEIIWLSLLQTIIQFFYMGLAHTSGVKSFYYRSGECIYCDSGSRIFVSSGKRLHQEKITGCILGFAGVVLINLNGMNFQFSLAGGAIFFFYDRLCIFFGVCKEIFSEI